MSVTHVIGVDPGLVHTGLVALSFDADNRVLRVNHDLMHGIDLPTIKGWCTSSRRVYVEAYRPRLKLGTDNRMLQAEAEIRAAVPSARFLPNMGIKKVVTEELMRLLEVWKFPTVSHHQDLRSAARIALLGMMKDDNLNHALAEMVREQLDFQTWTIQHG